MPALPLPHTYEVTLETSGLGIVFHAPSSANHIEDGQDYLTSHYIAPDDVLPHIYDGTIVGFGTGSPGSYTLRIHERAPGPDELSNRGSRLRLAVRSDGELLFRDLADLMDWESACPTEQRIPLPVGTYRVTLATDVPASGIVGDDQAIDVFFEQVDALPHLHFRGVPTL